MEEKVICDNCYLEAQGNFCSNCGAPLTDDAKQLIKQKEKNIKLSLINDLISIVEDVNTLNNLKEASKKILDK